MSPLQKGGLKLTDFSFAAYESYPFIESSHILRIFGNRRFKGNVLTTRAINRAIRWEV
jgi:hypothetical protein